MVEPRLILGTSNRVTFLRGEYDRSGQDWFRQCCGAGRGVGARSAKTSVAVGEESARKGQRLTRSVGQRRSLLIFDGLEPLHRRRSPSSFIFGHF